MDSDTSKLVQVIDDHGLFSTKFNELVGNWEGDILKKGFDYYIVAILGPQSSGKSTLLNLLFGTTFQVMNDNDGRHQTTKGVWLAKAKEGDIFVMDVEGTDSRERGDDMAVRTKLTNCHHFGKLSFERKTSLFSLVLAEILLINLWASANYGILKTVFELNLQLFARSKTRKTMLLFCIRDHVKTPLEKLSEQIVSDMKQIWSQLQKPAEFLQSEITDLFDLQFTSLPHKELDYPNFVLRVGELKQKFTGADKGVHFYSEKYRTDIPADGLAPYAEHVWETIRLNKDLDLPTEKEMLAMFRCDELLENAYKIYAGAIAAIKAEVEEKKYVMDFGATATAILAQALLAYDQPASRYHKEVAAKKRELLLTKISTDLHAMFASQIVIARREVFDEFTSSMSKTLPSQPPAVEGFTEKTTAMAAKAYSSFAERIAANRVQGVTEEWTVEADSAELKSTVTKKVAEAREAQLSLLAQELKNTLKALLAAPLSELLQNPAESFWPSARRLLEKARDKASADQQTRLEGFALDPTDVASRLAAVKTSCFDCLRETIVSKNEYLLFKMEKRFEEAFRYDARGLPRRWRPEDDISKLYIEARDKAEALLDQLAVLRLTEKDDHISIWPKQTSAPAPTPIPAGETNSAAAAPTSPDDKSAKAVPVERPIIDPSLLLLSFEQADQIRDRFRKAAEGIYMQALRDQEGVTMRNHVPPIFLVLLLALSLNEIQFVLVRPILCLLVIVLAGVCYVLFKLGLAGPAITVANGGLHVAAGLIHPEANKQKKE